MLSGLTSLLACVITVLHPRTSSKHHSWFINVFRFEEAQREPTENCSDSSHFFAPRTTAPPQLQTLPLSPYPTPPSKNNEQTSFQHSALNRYCWCPGV
ncbi:hypothetical protein IF2G_03040 [Cordyceps javanica]|nr:hypothetical protein IF2G_03040 [Cordyceps javanica]